MIMKKRIKTLLTLLVVFPLLSIIFSIYSCKSEDDVQIKDENILPSVNFLKAYGEFLPEFANAKIVQTNLSSHQMRRISSPTGENGTSIYVSIPDETPDNIRTQCEEVSTIGDMIYLSSEYAVRFSEIEESDTDFEIPIDLEAVIDQMRPLVASSKEYLYAKDFSDDEIQAMLDEWETSEEALVPFVYALCASELEIHYENLVDQDADYNASEYLSMLGMPQCYAITKDELLVAVGTTVYCAADAIGVNLKEFMLQSNLQTWTKAAIKRAGKTILKRLLGPIGAYIMTIGFIKCMGGISGIVGTMGILFH